MTDETNAEVCTTCPVKIVEAAGTEARVGIRGEREREGMRRERCKI